MYTVKRFYSEPQNTTMVQVEYKSADSADYEYFIRTLGGNLENNSDEEVIKMVLDKVRIKLNPSEVVVTMNDKITEMDEIIESAKQSVFLSQMSVLELTEVVYGLIDTVFSDPPEGEPEIPAEEPVEDPKEGE